MAEMGKYLTLCLVVILAVSILLMIKPAYAQTIPKPSVPEFTLKFVDNSYDIPPTYGIDEYTGKSIILRNGEHVDNRSIELKISNQPFTPSKDTNGKDICLYYTFRFKGQYGERWDYYPFSVTLSQDGTPTNTYTASSHSRNPDAPTLPIYPSSSSAYTVGAINIITLEKMRDPYGIPYNSPIPSGTQIDVQVQALVGVFDGNPYTLTGQSSDWSNTKTITIGESSSTNTPTPSPTVTPSPSLPNNGTTSSPNTNSELTVTLTWIIIGILVISVISLLLYVRHLKRRKPQN